MRRLFVPALIALCAVALVGCPKSKPEVTASSTPAGGTEAGPATTAPAKAVSTELALAAKVRPLAAAEWTEFCRTPGPVEVATGQNLALRPLDPQTFGDAELGQLAVDFAGLTSLTTLDLYDTGLTDAGLVHLAGLTNLTALDLQGTAVADAGLASIAGLTNLTTLNLDGTGLTDAGLVHLAGLTNLTALDLQGTDVADAGLANLAGLTKLTVLDLYGTGVTDAGVAALQEKLPDCDISR